MSDRIFIDETADPEDTPVNFVANPLRVQLPDNVQTGPRNARLGYAQIDLIALANAIVRKDESDKTARQELKNAARVVADLQRRVERLEADNARWVKLFRDMAGISDDGEYGPGDMDLIP